MGYTWGYYSSDDQEWDDEEPRECGYCGVLGTDWDFTPSVEDDESWAELAKQHGPDCEWVTTRAHRLEEPCGDE